MKIIFSTLILLFVVQQSLANVSPKDTVTGIIDKAGALIKIDEGKKFIAENKIREALQSFKDAALKDPNTWKAPFWVAYCHLKLKNFGYAKQYAKEAIKKDKVEVDPEVYVILAAACHQINELDDAEKAYLKAKELLPKARQKELEVDHRLTSVVYAKSQKDVENIATSLAGEVNSGYNDYSAILTDGGKRIYFTSRRANTTGGQINADDQEYFEDVYTGIWNEDLKKYDSISNNVERINGPGFETISWISNDGLLALVTLNTTATKEKKTTQSSDICEAEFTKQNKWTTPKPIKNKTINSGFFDGAATMTADGNTMYFVSDRKGDKRSTDIYMVQKVGNKWGKAVLLNDSVNSIYRETTPYITPDGRFLFFSSEGHVGMGGLDIFVAENTGSGWTKAVNLGAQVNSVNDDSHFILYKELGKATMTKSNVVDKKSSLDIFTIELSKLKLPIKL